MEKLTDICHAAVKYAPSGLCAEAIADILGVNYKTMMSELAGAERHKFDANLLVPLIRATGSDAPLKAIGRACGCVFFRLPGAEEGESPLTLTLAQSITKFGQMLSALGDAMDDGVISRVEAERINTEGHEALQAIIQVLKVAEKMANG